MRSLVLAVCAVLTLAACPSTQNPTLDPDTGVPDTGTSTATPDGGCARPCGAECCAVGTSCNPTTDHCESCTPNCSGGKNCGDDGCGGSCGTCTGAKQWCDEAGGVCKTCLTDLCDGVCCGEGKICNATSKKCEGCTPDCTDRQCGDNGCGGSCGVCGVMNSCAAGKCTACMPEPPPDATCGQDNKGCTFGLCASDQYCTGGQCAYCPRPLCNGACCLEGELCNPNTLACEACVPQCAGKKCGPDGCGGTCAPGCAAGEACGVAGACTACTATCGTRKCGADKDGCGCGACTGNDTCIDGLCQTCSRPLCNGVCCEAGSKCDSATNRCQRCLPDCSGKICGDDGCGGECGACETGQSCAGGTCQAGCTPNCAGGKNCGADGCGGKCGADCDNQTNFCIDGKCTACTPEQDPEICARLQAECGQPVARDNCDNLRQPQAACGPACSADKTCDPRLFKCVVPCVPETEQQMCARLERTCGSVSGSDNCGTVKFVADCGSCATGKTCVSGKCQ
ncbi:MAG TPA: hypothetical protein VGK67_09325 [Myxococcales bacterium]|jgi:hypothetical protein